MFFLWRAEHKMFTWIKNKILGERVEMQSTAKTERYYQLKCNEVLQGKVEYRLSDATRVDILTEDLAIEVDFAKKYYEAIGQACHYAEMTERKPAILLIVREKYQEKYVEAAGRLCKSTKIRVGGEDYHIVMMVYRDFS